MPRRNRLTGERKRRFLEARREGSTVAGAARAAGVSRMTAYRDRWHLRHDGGVRVEVVVSLPEPEDTAGR